MARMIVETMIVEDHHLFAETLKDALGRMLQRENGSELNFTIFPSAEAALQDLEGRRYDIFISDVNLGKGMNGFKFIERAKDLAGSHHHHECLWILMSANYENIYDDEARRLGAIFIRKNELNLFVETIKMFARLMPHVPA